MRLLTSNPCTLECVHKSKYFWSFPSCVSKPLESWPSIFLEITRIWPSINPLEWYIRNPLDTLKGRSWRERKLYSIVSIDCIYLSLHPFVPLEHFVLFPSLHFLVSFLSRDGGLRWWMPTWRNRFLWFADVPIEVVTCVISGLISRNIFSCPIMCNWIWILNPWMCLIVFALLNIYARVGLTHYYRACLSFLLLLRVNC